MFLITMCLLSYFADNNNNYYDEHFGGDNSGGNSSPNTSFEQMEKQRTQNDTISKLVISNAFQDLVLYDNDDDGARLGLDKCAEVMKQKGGTCVPYGISGTTVYYPPSEFDYYKDLQYSSG